MGRWIRFWGVGVFLIIALSWYLSIDWIVKKGIETYGTEANGARVELSSVNLSLWPTTLELYGLKVTDAANPMFNLVEAGQISTQLDGLMLLRRQLIIDSAVLSKLKFNTPRKSSGAIGKTKTSKPDEDSFNFDIGSAIPGVSLPNIDTLLKNEEKHLKGKINKIEQRLSKIEQRWKKNIEKLPDEDSVDEYKARWKKLKKASFIEKIAGFNGLKNDINKEIDLIKSLDKQLKEDKIAVENELKNAKALPGREANRLMKKVGLSNKEISFMRALTGEQVAQWLQQGLGIFKKITQVMASGQSVDTPPRGEGRWVRFQEQNPLPQLLIKKATLDGVVSLADVSISFEGKAANFAFPPSDWNQAATLALKGNDTQKASFQLDATFDHRQADFNDELTLQANKLRLTNLTLSDSKEMGLTLKTARTDIKGFAKLNPKTIALNFTGTFSQAKLVVDSKIKNTTQQVIADSLSAVDNFNLQLIVKGDIKSPNIKLRSNLDKALTAGLKKQIAAQSGKLKQKLKQQIKKNLSAKLSALDSKADYLNQIEDLLNSRKTEMKKLKRF